MHDGMHMTRSMVKVTSP